MYFSNIDGVFMCLEILLKINHLLIEPILPHIWSLSLSLSSQLEEERKVREGGRWNE